MEPEFLYRGYNCNMTLEETLKPKAPSDCLESGALCGDDRVQFGDMDFTFGLNIANTIHSHEYGGNGTPTSGISTTSKFEVAKKYALGKDKNLRGRIIKMSVAGLKNAGVQIYCVNKILNNPSIPDDDEYWIYFNSTFPKDAIVDENDVFP